MFLWLLCWRKNGDIERNGGDDAQLSHYHIEASRKISEIRDHLFTWLKFCILSNSFILCGMKSILMCSWVHWTESILIAKIRLRCSWTVWPKAISLSSSPQIVRTLIFCKLYLKLEIKTSNLLCVGQCENHRWLIQSHIIVQNCSPQANCNEHFCFLFLNRVSITAQTTSALSTHS